MPSNTKSIYADLNVKPIINATGTFTRLSGSLMPDEVVAAMNAAAKEFVCIEDLQHAAGKIIAEITGAEAGYVTSGAQAGLVLSIAACIAGLDPIKMDRSPHTEGMKHQVIMASVHRNHYDHAVEAAGGRIVEVGTAEQVTAADYVAAINDQTAAVLFLPWGIGGITLPDVVAAMQPHGIPVVVDGAGRLSEPENLQRLIAQGADLVVFSGGKYIRGPQSSGIVCGRRELISSIAWQHLDMDATPEVWTAPRELLNVEEMPFLPRQGIGRGYKAGKEEIVGLITALRLFAASDHTADLARQVEQLKTLGECLDGTPHIQTEFIEPSPERAGVRLARIRIDETGLGMTAYDVIRALKQGTPAIHPAERELASGSLIIHPFGLQEGDAEKIANRIKEIVA